MSFAKAAAGMDAALVKTFGETCTYTPLNGEPVELSAVIEYELSFYTQFTDVVSGGVVITVLVADVPNPKNGDKLTDASGKNWKILKPLENDGSVAIVNAVQDHRAPGLT